MGNYSNDTRTCFKFVFFLYIYEKSNITSEVRFTEGKKRSLLFLMNIYTYIILCFIRYSGRKCTQRTSILETTFTTLWCACSRAEYQEGYIVATTIIVGGGGGEGGEGRCED